jgi:4-hydroxy-4-methyl-2-oxoglutarate aldolase
MAERLTRGKQQDARRWIQLGSAAVSDALRGCGKAFQSMDAGIRPLARSVSLAGPAFTVRCYPGATWALEKALELASPGDVLVVDGGAYPDAILMGGLMSVRAAARRLGGAIVDGAVRDIQHILKVGFPVFSRSICPRAGTFAEIGEWQTVICCGRIPITPGDWIVADASGVTVVPQDLRAEVLEAAEAIYQKEQSMTRSLRSGKSLAESASDVRRNGHPRRKSAVSPAPASV